MINRPINPWWSVAAGALGSALGAGMIIAYAYGIIAVPMAQEFGWDRSVVAANTTAFLVGSGIGSALLGFLINRFGIRGPAATMAAAFGLCLAIVAILPPVPWIHHLIFVMIGIAGAACTALPYSVAVSGFFNERRGLALGLVVAGAGFGGTFAPPIVQSLVGNVGWRETIALVGLTAGLFPMLGLIFFVRTPAGAVTRRDSDSAAERPTPLRRVALDPHAWLILVPILLVSIAGWGTVGAIVPLLHDRGLDPLTIASILSFAGLVAWVARVAVGYLLDRVFAPLVTATIFTLTAIGLLMLGLSDSIVALYLGVCFVTIAIGTESDLVTFLVSRYFKLIDFSRLVGILWVVWSWGGGLGTAINSQIYQRTHNYTATLFLFSGLLMIGAVLICFIGPYRNPVHAVRGRPPIRVTA